MDLTEAPSSSLNEIPSTNLTTTEVVDQQIRIHFLYLPLAAICFITAAFLFYNSIYTCGQKFRIWKGKRKESHSRNLKVRELAKHSVTAQDNNYVDVEVGGVNARSVTGESDKTKVKCEDSKSDTFEGSGGGGEHESTRTGALGEPEKFDPQAICPIRPERPKMNKKTILKLTTDQQKTDESSPTITGQNKSENCKTGSKNKQTENINSNSSTEKHDRLETSTIGQNNSETPMIVQNNSAANTSRADSTQSPTGGHNSITNKYLKKLALYKRDKKQVAEKDSGDQKTETIKDVSSWFKLSQPFDVPILMYLYVFFTLAAGLESALGRFLPVYAEVFTNTSFVGPDPSLMLFAFWASLALGRLLAVSLTPLLPPNAVMLFCLLLNLLSSSILSAYGHNYSGVLWLFVCSLGCALGPILPGGLTWANIFIPLRSPKSIALVVVMIGIGMALCSWVSGFVVGYFDGTSLLFLSTAVSGVSFLLYVPVMVKLGGRSALKVEDNVTKNPKRTYV